LTIPCSLSCNGYLVNVSSLTNSGANGFAFINTLLAIDITTFFNLKFQHLSKPISIKGYNSKLGTRITHFLRMYLTINQRRQYNIPLLILELGSHNLILGRKWLEYFDLLLDIRNRRLIWPELLPLLLSVVREIPIPREALLPAPRHTPYSNYQVDIKARDYTFDRED
jgi:hypothetical protein